MKRIVILSAFLTPFRSGAEACAEEVPLALQDQFDFTIVTARLRRDLPKHDRLRGAIPVIRIGLGFPIDKWLYPFLAPLVVRRLQPHIVHAVLETFAGLVLHLCKWFCPSAKRVLTLQTTNRSFLKGVIVRSPHAVTAISKALADTARSLGREDVTVIPNGIDLRAIRAACERKVRFPGRILFVGRLEPQKGVDTLLEAFAQVAPHVASAHLNIVGAGSLHSQLSAYSSQLRLRDRVAFAGFVAVPAVYEEFAAAEIFCGLSRSEALGNVFLEAQAAGCAVIGTRIGGIPEIIEDGQTGLLVPAGDPTAAAEVLQKLLTDSSLRLRLAEKGMKHAASYDWQQLAAEYAEVYEWTLF